MNEPENPSDTHFSMLQNHDFLSGQTCPYNKEINMMVKNLSLTHFCPPFQHLLSERLTSLGIMGAPWVPPLNPSETIVLSEHYRL